MGADFICSVAEFKYRPDFEAGIKFIRTTPAGAFQALIEESNLHFVFPVKDYLVNLVRFIEENWDDHSVSLSNSRIIVFAGESYGEPIDGAEALEYLEITGVLKAMGGL